jgi:hypothetical protein
MVPCPWFEEAARLCNENPGLEVGIHLTLTSEWNNVKWRPLSHTPSLVNKDGYFCQMTVSGWPPGVKWPLGTAFMDAAVKVEDVEKELRAQIELAKRKITNVTHLSVHMGTATCRPELRVLVDRLAKEYRLITWDDLAKKGLKYAGNWGSGNDLPDQRAAALAEKLRQLGPGTWIIVEHPGLDTPEMQAMGHPGSDRVARSRWGVAKAFTSPQVKKIVGQRGIQLITCADLKKNPVFLYFADGFQKPNAFKPDIVVSIDSVIDTKMDALVAIVSQFIEGGCGGGPGSLPKDEADLKRRQDQLRQGWIRQLSANWADGFRGKLIDLYGEATAKQVRYAEAFEVCEYGRRPSAEELQKLFPAVTAKP